MAAEYFASVRTRAHGAPRHPTLAPSPKSQRGVSTAGISPSASGRFLDPRLRSLGKYPSVEDEPFPFEEVDVPAGQRDPARSEPWLRPPPPPPPPPLPSLPPLTLPPLTLPTLPPLINPLPSLTLQMLADPRPEVQGWTKSFPPQPPPPPPNHHHHHQTPYHSRAPGHDLTSTLQTPLGPHPRPFHLPLLCHAAATDQSTVPALRPLPTVGIPTNHSGFNHHNLFHNSRPTPESLGPHASSASGALHPLASSTSSSPWSSDCPQVPPAPSDSRLPRLHDNFGYDVNLVLGRFPSPAFNPDAEFDFGFPPPANPGPQHLSWPAMPSAPRRSARLSSATPQEPYDATTSPSAAPGPSPSSIDRQLQARATAARRAPPRPNIPRATASTSATNPATSSPRTPTTATRPVDSSSSIPSGTIKRKRDALTSEVPKNHEASQQQGQYMVQRQSPGFVDDPDMEVVDLCNTEEIPKDLLVKPKPKNEIKLDAFQCVICMDNATNLTVTHCGHLFCGECLFESLHTNPSKHICPVCRTKIDRPSAGAAPGTTKPFSSKQKGYHALKLKIMKRKKGAPKPASSNSQR